MPSLVELEEQIITDLYLVKPELAQQVHSGDSLVQQHGIESLDMVELIARIEDRFQVPIEDNDWKKLQSIHQLAQFIQHKLNSEHAG